MSDPILKERACGGWLAVGTVFKFGVTADTEEEARDLFRRAEAAWANTLGLSICPTCGGAGRIKSSSQAA